MEKHNYFDMACSFYELYKGLKKACRNIRWKDSVVGYESNVLKNTLKLKKRLLSGNYRISKYQKLTVYEPKKREILASRLVDRQFQRSLCDCGLYEDITEHLIRDNVACQIGKGTGDALKRLKIHLHRYYRLHGADGWVLKCDIHHFFPSTRHDTAKDAVNKYVSDEKAAKAVSDVIDSFGGDIGIGLGSQISQLVEILVLNDLDHFIKEQLRIKYYIRYMDDFILIHDDKEYLKYCKNTIEKKLGELGFKLNNKTSIQTLKHGIVFLQWRFILTSTGKVLILMNPKKIARQKKRMKKLYEKELSGEVRKGSVHDSLQSFLANAANGNTYRVQEAMKTFYFELTGEKF